MPSERLMSFEVQPFNRNVPDEALLEDLVAAKSKLQLANKSLTFRTYREVGKYSPSTINDRFGSWNTALQKAGLIPCEEKNIPTEALFDNLKLVWMTKGKQPVYRDMSNPPSQYTGSTYSARFGGWRTALQAFVAATANEEQELMAVIPPLTLPRAPRTNRDPSLSLRFYVLKRDHFRCRGCGRSPATTAGLTLEIDHIQPWSKGGSTVAENLQTLCFDCNRGKNTT